MKTYTMDIHRYVMYIWMAMYILGYTWYIHLNTYVWYIKVYTIHIPYIYHTYVAGLHMYGIYHTYTIHIPKIGVPDGIYRYILFHHNEKKYVPVCTGTYRYILLTHSHTTVRDSRWYRYYTISYVRHTISYVGKNPDVVMCHNSKTFVKAISAIIVS